MARWLDLVRDHHEDRDEDEHPTNSADEKGAKVTPIWWPRYLELAALGHDEREALRIAITEANAKARGEGA